MAIEDHSTVNFESRPLAHWLWWALPGELKIRDRAMDVDLFGLHEEICKREGHRQQSGSSGGNSDEQFLRLLASVAVETWRLERRVEKLKSDDLGSRVTRPLESTVDKLTTLLQERGVVIQDYDDRVFHDGLIEVSVVAEEPDSSRPDGERIISETVSPSVLIHGRRILNADVIVSLGVNEQDDTDDS
jgi:hypothetical protein